ncbi:hypothetical protein P168DRAFT_300498 [Aspergillus campestris IBT 28561]|uniref:Uncharacterized protein n=1 Tax=Aspergillus campestris (strain IBT 28561) TaxID=1392248 RepID=A0A2I1CQ04_ASPC2|nr:hypothetical protein P168DRAFT_300498 [Aspergillus campestris IBT 28561]
MNAWLPQASYPVGHKGSIGHTFMVFPLGHLRCGLTDVPPQPNSPPDNVVVFHWRRSSHLFYTPYVFSQCQTRVKLNRVFFPR